jgi:hypothetical protein
LAAAVKSSFGLESAAVNDTAIMAMAPINRLFFIFIPFGSGLLRFN